MGPLRYKTIRKTIATCDEVGRSEEILRPDGE